MLSRSFCSVMRSVIIDLPWYSSGLRAVKKMYMALCAGIYLVSKEYVIEVSPAGFWKINIGNSLHFYNTNLFQILTGYHRPNNLLSWFLWNAWAQVLCYPLYSNMYFSSFVELQTCRVELPRNDLVPSQLQPPPIYDLIFFERLVLCEWSQKNNHLQLWPASIYKDPFWAM